MNISDENEKKVDYDKFAKTFSKSRINMKWEEINYFLDFMRELNSENGEKIPLPPFVKGEKIEKDFLNVVGEENSLVEYHGNLKQSSSSSSLIKAQTSSFPLIKGARGILTGKNLDLEAREISTGENLDSTQKISSKNPNLIKAQTSSFPLVKEARGISTGKNLDSTQKTSSTNPNFTKAIPLNSPLIKGGRGISKFIPYNRNLKEKSRELRKNMTNAEKEIWYKFLKNRDEKILRQKPLLNYIVDFYIPSAGLIIEIDGDSHFQPNYLKYENDRTKKLNSYGLEIIRFTNIEIYENFEGVCLEIDKKIKEKTLFNDNEGKISILDVGCGNGRLLQSLKTLENIEFDYLGVDASTGLVNEAKKINPDFDFGVLDMRELNQIEKIPLAPFIKGEFDNENKGRYNEEIFLIPFVKGKLDDEMKGKENPFFKREFKKENQDKFDYIFFIASFHHLQSIEERLEVLSQTKKLLKSGGKIFMTNWDLQSDLNKEKYKKSIIEKSKNQFLSQDYSIKIGKFTRFYHSFTLEELQYLFQKSGFQIIENRLFENGRNIVSIVF